jgi:hypothetical protein
MPISRTAPTSQIATENTPENRLPLLAIDPSAFARKVVCDAKQNSRGEADLLDRVLLVKCNLPIRKIMKKYWDVDLNTDELERIYVLFQMARNQDGQWNYETFKANLIGFIGIKHEGEVDEVEIKELFGIYQTGRVEINIAQTHSTITKLNTVLMAQAETDSQKQRVNMKNVQALYLWYVDNKETQNKSTQQKENIFYIKQNLARTCKLLFGFDPSNLWEIYSALSSSSASFVHEVTNGNIMFDNSMDLSKCWQLDCQGGMEKLKAHYNTALAFLLELHRFKESKSGPIKMDLTWALAALQAKYPQAVGILIPEAINIDPSHKTVEPADDLKIFESQKHADCLDMLENLQNGTLKLGSQLGSLTEDKEKTFKAPFNQGDWNLTILSRFILDLMFLDNGFKGRYNYYNLNKLRNKLIQSYTTPSLHKSAEFSFKLISSSPETIQMSAMLKTPQMSEVIEIKVIIPGIKTPTSLIRKILAKNVDLKQILDVLRIRVVLPASLKNQPEVLDEVCAALTTFFISRHGDTLYETPKSTFGIENKRHNQYSNASFQMFKIVLREHGEVTSQGADQILEISRGVQEQVAALTSSALLSSTVMAHQQMIRKLIEANVSTEVFKIISESLADQQGAIVQHMLTGLQTTNELNQKHARIQEEASKGQALATTIEIQIVCDHETTEDAKADDHDEYEWKQILKILKLKLPYYYRAVKQCFIFLAFQDYESCAPNLRMLYVWSLQVVFKAIFENPELYAQLIADDKVDNKLLEFVFNNMLTVQEEKAIFLKYFSQEEFNKLVQLHNSLKEL